MSNIGKYSLGTTFNQAGAEHVFCLGYAPEENPNPFVPSRNDNYVFRKDFLMQITAFLTRPMGDALYLTGPTGSGKTSGVTEVAARLNWPVQQITATGRMELSDLVGHHALVSPKPGMTPVMQFMYGPLVVAMKEGHILLINEVDLADPAELAGLNDVLEGRPLVIGQNGGEIIKPHPMFRVVVTGNSAGSGDATGRYQGVMMQNLAAMDRYRFTKVDYPEEAVELDILNSILPVQLRNMAPLMVKSANKIRFLFTGENGDDGQIGVTMSTRTLARWARLSLQFRGAKNSVGFALEHALLLRASPEERVAIIQVVKDVFGQSWTEEE